MSFVDGTAGEVHVLSFLSNPKVNGTVFEPLLDSAVFVHAQVVLGTTHETKRGTF
jgi:hypothetical protein